MRRLNSGLASRTGNIMRELDFVNPLGYIASLKFVFVFTGTGGKQKPPTPCPVGHYCPPGTKHPMQHKCAPGTWSNRTSLTSEEECFPCPAGWFCVGGARSPTGMCSSGHYCPQGRQLFAGMKEICFISAFGIFVDSGKVRCWLDQHIFSTWSSIENSVLCSQCCKSILFELSIFVSLFSFP